MRKTEYINKSAAAKRTGLSVRRLLELAQRGDVRKQFVSDPNTKRKIAVFAVEDLDHLKDPGRCWPVSGAERRSMLRSGAAGAASPATLPRTTERGETNGEDTIRTLVRQWMTLAEADAYIGLPEGFLLLQVKSGKLPALDVGVRAGGRWRVSKRDLEAIAAAPAAIS